jgi:hypothetical protein
MSLYARCYLLFRFSDSHFICISQNFQACYMLRPSHPFLFHYPYNTWWRVQTMKFLTSQLFSAFHYFISRLAPNVFIITCSICLSEMKLVASVTLCEFIRIVSSNTTSDDQSCKLATFHRSLKWYMVCFPRRFPSLTTCTAWRTRCITMFSPSMQTWLC